MKTLLIAIAATAALGASSGAFADTTTPQTYASLGVLSQTTHKSDTKLNGINARVGERITKHFGVEGEAAVGTNKDTTAAGTYKLTHKVAAYGVGYLPVSDNIDLFARAGLADTRLKIPAGAPNDETGTSVDYGVGAQYHVDKAYAVRADLTKSDYINHHGNANTATLSLVRAF